MKGGVEELLAEILAGTQDRPHALCIGQHHVVDDSLDGDQDALRTLAWLCRRCPHAADCDDAVTPPTPKPTPKPAPRRRRAPAPPKGPPPPAPCTHCGETFQPHRSDSKFCSPACRTRAYRQRAYERRNAS